MDLYVILALLCLAFVIGVLVFYFYNQKTQEQTLIYRGEDGKFHKKIVCKKGVKYYLFLFRWFLIGKYHCEFKHGYTKKAFVFIGECLRCYIIFCCVIVTAAIIRAFL